MGEGVKVLDVQNPKALAFVVKIMLLRGGFRNEVA